ncbi:hypothetical protein GGQ60_004539 [Pedobacter zeae]|uniref:Uncharacterized protein n=1 Tax=Pedobacter zeae TaxID=1737356 RepID=A0A7W6P8W5_9SPHI|nr:hypothetical protein [Pedobacter zeae]
MFHGSVSPALRFTPLHSVFAPIRFKNKRKCHDLKSLPFKIFFSFSVPYSLQYCYRPGHLNPMEVARSTAYSGTALTQMPLNLLSKKERLFFSCFGKQNLCFIAALVLLFALLRYTPCSRRSGLGTQNSAVNRKNNSSSSYFGALQPQILLPAGPPKPDGSDTKYSVQRDCINPNATKPAFQKRKIIYSCLEKQNLCFIAALVLRFALLRCTPCSRRSGLRTKGSATTLKIFLLRYFFHFLCPAAPNIVTGRAT